MGRSLSHVRKTLFRQVFPEVESYPWDFLRACKGYASPTSDPCAPKKLEPTLPLGVSRPRYKPGLRRSRDYEQGSEMALASPGPPTRFTYTPSPDLVFRFATKSTDFFQAP